MSKNSSHLQQEAEGFSA